MKNVHVQLDDHYGYTISTLNTDVNSEAGVDDSLTRQSIDC